MALQPQAGGDSPSKRANPRVTSDVEDDSDEEHEPDLLELLAGPREVYDDSRRPWEPGDELVVRPHAPEALEGVEDIAAMGTPLSELLEREEEFERAIAAHIAVFAYVGDEMLN